MDGPTFNAQIMRTLSTGATFFNSTATPNANTVAGGVIPGSGEFTVTAGSGMTINVAAGNCLVPSSAGASQGGYLVSLMANANLSIATSDPTNPRIDLVCVTATDNGNNTSFGQVQVITGTPAPSPAAPSAPSNSVSLYTVTVPAAATSSSSFTISSVLSWTVPAGGIMPVWGLSGFQQGWLGHYVHDRNSGRLMHNPPGGAVQPVLLPYPPVTSYSTAPQFEGGTAEVTSLTLTFTSDGNTDWDFYYKCGAVQATQSGAPAYSAIFRMYVDSTQVDAIYSPNANADGNNHYAAAWKYTTSAAQGTRPTASTHTLKVTWQTTSGFGIELFAASSNRIVLRASPVAL